MSPDPIQTYTVDWVSQRDNTSPCWLVHMTDQEGAGRAHVFPHDTLEWRAAEYGLTDVDEILDIVLHEPHLPDAPDRDDAALRAGLVTSSAPDAQPITLFNARSTGDALAAHRLRVADTKRTWAQVRSPGKGKDPLDAIRVNHGITAHGLRGKQELVDTHRWSLIYGGFPVPDLFATTPEAPRA